MVKTADLSVAETIQLGESILVEGNDQQVLVSGELFANASEAIISAAPGWTPPTLKAFKDLHHKVLKRVELSLESTKQALRDTKKMGRGIKTYATSEVNNVLQRQYSILSKKKI